MPAEKEEQIVTPGGMWPKYVDPGQMVTGAGTTEDLPAGMKPESVSAAMPAAPAPGTQDEPPGMRPQMQG
jgi:hypothetical protein